MTTNNPAKAYKLLEIMAATDDLQRSWLLPKGTTFSVVEEPATNGGAVIRVTDSSPQRERLAVGIVTLFNVAERNWKDALVEEMF